MSLSDRVRTTRDGDQFHYIWAARRCLRLLDPSSDLAAVTIEGVSKLEGHRASVSSAGEELVDIAEYYGSERLADARAVEYLQLKHSTVRTDQDWTASGLAKTLKGFGAKHRALLEEYGDAWVQERVGYGFVTNRPVSARVRQTAAEIAAGKAISHPDVATELKRHTKLPAKLQAGFFAKLTFSDSAAKFTDQSNLLSIEASHFLVGEDLNAALQLEALVSKRATTIGAANPSIVRADVLQAMHVAPDQLFPAPSELVPDPAAVPRLQEVEIAAALVAARDPVIIAAPGGVGKSVLATRLPGLLPEGSVAVVFDCFAEGAYRRPTKLRHLPKQALIQIVSELSAQGLCLPLLPTSGADAQAYLRGFVDRLTQASFAVRAEHADAVLAIIVDAADNAVMAAEEFVTAPAFVRALLHEPMPDGVRLAMLCRPERRYMLDPPTEVVDLTLRNFDRGETAALLRHHYPTATDAQVEEFHRLSSENPRVQANALAVEPTLQAALRSLGPNPTSVDDTINEQLRRGVAKLRKEAGKQAGDVDILCVAMAALRPLIPLRVLSAVTGLRVEALHSFASDFGRGRWLMTTAEAVQFRDEPVEHWFRKTYAATPAQLKDFVSKLSPLADEFPYVAATLPSLMLECGQLAELVELALSAEKLPVDSPLDRREIELERLRFALRASLKSKRWLDAAKLAHKAGEEAAGQARHEALLEENTDLVGELLEAESLLEIASRRRFGGGWLGERYCREAALLSRKPEVRGDALNRLKIANDLLNGWARLSPEARQEQDVSHEDRADFMLAVLNLHGAKAAVQDLMRWSPPGLWFEATLIAARRLVDHGRFMDADEIAEAAASKKARPIIVAVTLALSEVSRLPPKDVVELALKLSAPKAGSPNFDDWTLDTGLLTVTVLVEAGLRHGYADHKRLARLLVQALPKTPPRMLGADYTTNRPAYLRARALLLKLRGRDIVINDVATEELRKAMASNQYSRSREADDFTTRVGASLPWWRLRAELLLNPGHLQLGAAISAAATESGKAYGHYGEERSVQDEVAIARFDILAIAPAASAADLAAFDQWVDSQKRGMFTPTWTALARKAARHLLFQSRAHHYAQKAVSEETDSPTDHADTRIDALVKTARALLAYDREEAGLLFDRAVDVASRLGDEVFQRWEAILALAHRSADTVAIDPQLTYRLSRCAELTSHYVDRHFDWHGSIDGMAGIAPAAAIAAVSRWRDREIGWFRELHVALWDALRKHAVVDPRLGVALLGYRFGWSIDEVLEQALAAAASADEKSVLLDLVVHGARLDEASDKIWLRLADLARTHGLPSPPLQRGLEEALFRKRTEPPSKESSPIPRGKPINWAKAVSTPLPTFASVVALKQKIKGRGFDNEQFWRAAFGQIPPDAAATMVRDALGPEGLDLYEVRTFFEAFPPAWRQRLAVRRALKESTSDLLRRECWRLSAPHNWAPLTVERVVQWSGMSTGEVASVALEAMAADPDPADASQLFNLAALLAEQLDVGEARDALGHSLALIEASLPADFAEGVWSPALAPDPDVERAIAGLIWATLGSVHRDLRWEAAHVVRRLVTLGRDVALAELLRLAATDGGGPFTSAKLFFYLQDARQWLLIALARAALEHPVTLAKFKDQILPFGCRSHPHVVIRHYASSALLALDAAQAITLTTAIRDELKNVNTSIFPVVDEEYYQPPKKPYQRKGPERDFSFDYDMAKGMMDSLGRAFGTSMAEVEDVGGEVIHTDWGLGANGHWDREPRRYHSAFQHSRRGSAVDRLNQYLTYHATQCVAAKLLDRLPVHRYRGAEMDEFAEWMEYRTLTRTDGRWVADHRDPVPLLTPTKAVKPELWPWSVERADFGRAILNDGPQLVVWGRWTQQRSKLEQRTAVHSSLVSPKTAGSLLMAAQTAKVVYDIPLSPEHEEDDVAAPNYELKAWVADWHRDLKVDGKDPWAAALAYPPPAPASIVREKLKLIEHDDRRSWAVKGQQTPLFTVRTWSKPIPAYEEHSPPHGEQLLISRRSLPSVLRKFGLDLIMQVLIDRTVIRSSYERERDEMIEYPNSYFMVFLFRQDGTVETLF